MLEDGKPAEYGTHAELLEKGGIYKSVFDKQQLEKQLQADVPDVPGNAVPGGDPA